MTAILAVESGGSYIDLPTPYEYTTKNEEIVESEGRTTSADMILAVKAVKRTITVRWLKLTPAEHTLIANLTRMTSDHGDFNVRYFDIDSKTFKYGNFYRANDMSQAPLRTPKAWNGAGFDYYTASLQLIEM